MHTRVPLLSTDYLSDLLWDKQAYIGNPFTSVAEPTYEAMKVTHRRRFVLSLAILLAEHRAHHLDHPRDLESIIPSCEHPARITNHGNEVRGDYWLQIGSSLLICTATFYTWCWHVCVNVTKTCPNELLSSRKAQTTSPIRQQLTTPRRSTLPVQFICCGVELAARRHERSPSARTRSDNISRRLGLLRRPTDAYNALETFKTIMRYIKSISNKL